MKGYFGFGVFCLFCGMLGFYLLAGETVNPVSLARAEAIRIEARSDAELARAYANQDLADRTAARERQSSDGPWVMTIAIIVICGIITGGAVTVLLLIIQRNNLVGRAIQGGPVISLGGQRYRAISANDDRVLLERTETRALVDWGQK